MIGQSLSHYRVLEKLGAGGMGEVYRAHDTKLNRDVALKVLPEALAHDSERMARFKREAQVLASLNHSNIATIYGFEEAEGIRALAMELVEGQTLAERIQSGAVPLKEAVPVVKQIAEALEYAHERGIIHRDLKPANVKVTPDGIVKVLDFGLAKALEADASSSNLSDSPTLSHPISVAATQAGVILGTAAYMSPEQAKGKNVDRRTDIWSFGCVLYEMLTGKRPFEGEDLTETVVALMRNEPDWEALPATTPAAIRKLLRRCLTKDPKQRLRDIGEARIALEDQLASPGAEVASQPVFQMKQRVWKRALPWVITMTLGVVSAILVASRFDTERGSHPVVRFSLPAPTRFLGSSLALSPDGKYLIYPLEIPSGKIQLYSRRMDEFESRPVTGTEGAADPFFSPDGRWLGFRSEAKLKKMQFPGGSPTVICEYKSPDTAKAFSTQSGANWGPDGRIYFSMGTAAGIYRVPVEGGVPEQLTLPDEKKGEFNHAQPQLLPGGRAILFSSWEGMTIDRAVVKVLATGQERTVQELAVGARYVPTGHLVFRRGNQLMAVPFDVSRLETTGPPVVVVDGVLETANTHMAMFDVSPAGTLVFVPGTGRGIARGLVWVDRHGGEQPVTPLNRYYDQPRLSPDNTQVALTIRDQGSENIWIYDLRRGTLSRFTFESKLENETPLWTPDGKRVVFSADRNGRKILWKAADGSGPEEVLMSGKYHIHLHAISPDGQALVYSEYSPGEKDDLWVLPLTGERKPAPLVQTPFNEYGGSFSPDGRWLAYASDACT